MALPFTTEQFLAIFEEYNRTLWPVQIVLNGLGLTALILALRPVGSSNRIIGGILGFLWIWIGAAYHLAFFASINPAARLFGAANLLQGGLFLYYGVVRNSLVFEYRRGLRGFVGILFALYAFILYPALGALVGHVYPQAPTFGLPCPTTIFTFGILLFATGKVPAPLLVIPLLWSLIGFSAALTMGIFEDIGLLVAGVAGTGLILFKPLEKTHVGRP